MIGLLPVSIRIEELEGRLWGLVRYFTRSLPFFTLFLNTVCFCSELEPLSPGGIVGSADGAGHVVYRYTVGHVRIGDQIRPLTVSFSSDPSFRGGLGAGWGFPLLESSLSYSNNYTLLWNCPSGREIALMKQDDCYVSQNNKFTCVSEGAEGWLMKSIHTGERYVYKGGSLNKYSSSEGVSSRFYSNQFGRTSGIDRSLSVRNGTRGNISRIIGENLDLKIDYGERGLPMGYHNFTIDAGAVKRIEVEFSLEKLEGIDSELVKMEISYPEGPSDYYIWDAETGVIVEDRTYTYNYRQKKGLVEISAARSDGYEVSWKYSSATGIEEFVHGNRKTQNKIILSAGNTYRKLREQQVSEGARVVKAQTYSYGPNGELLRINDNIFGRILTLEGDEHEQTTRDSRMFSSDLWRVVKNLRDLSSLAPQR